MVADVTQAAKRLAMALAAEGRLRQVGANQREQGRVIERGFRSSFSRYGRSRRRRIGGIVCRARESPRGADALHAVNAAGGRGGDGRSCARPPPDKRVLFLAAGAQQFDLHAQFADAPVGLIEPQLRRIVSGADLQGLLQAAERLRAPFLEARRGHRGLAAERIERFAAQQAQHHFGFAFRAPAQRGSFQIGAPGGSGLEGWAVLFSGTGLGMWFIGFWVHCPVSKEIGGDIPCCRSRVRNAAGATASL